MKLGKAKPYRGHTIVRRLLHNQLMFLAVKNGVEVAKAYSVRELQIKLDALLDGSANEAALPMA